MKFPGTYRILILLGILASATASAEDYPPWKIGLSFENVAARAQLIPIGANGQTVDSLGLTFSPAESDYFGVILGYKWLAGTISFSIPASAETRAIEGESKYHDYRLSYYFPTWGFEANYDSYESFSIMESDRLQAGEISSGGVYHLPEMRSQGFGLIMMKTLTDSSYQLSAAVDQSSLQKGSAGSFIGILSARYQNYTNPGPFIPPAEQGNFGTAGTTNRINTYNLAGGIGYGYLYDGPGSFFVSGLVALSAGPHQIQSFDSAGSHTKATFGANVHGRISMGFNGKTGFLKIGALIDSYDFKMSTTKVSNMVTDFLISGGLRF